MSQTHPPSDPTLTSIAAQLYVRDLNVSTEFFTSKLGFSVDVFNVFNGQAPLNLSPDLNGSSAGTPNPLYGTPLVQQQPRYVRIGVTYDY